MNLPVRQSGVSMIEVLVTIAVIGFGFLSLLSLQIATLNTLSANNQNYVAVSLANGMGERLRANRDNAAFYNGMATADFDKDCSGGNCNMVEFDVWQWKQSLVGEGQLPDGAGVVAVLGGLATVTIEWTEKRARNETERKSYVLEVPL